jgi:signal peptide peptidase SppA
MRHASFLAHALATPWALQREVLAAYAGVLARKFAHPQAMEDDDIVGGRNAAAKTVGGQRSGSIAVVPLYGTIMQRANMMEMCGGGTSVQTFTDAFRQALADETVSQILIDIDSPGGSVYGVGELAAEVYSARNTKPVVAVANSLAASAAYWIGCSAQEFYCTPGGEVGSIGVWQAHEDWSAAMAEAGVKTTLISAGKYKTEGNPYQPLDEDAQAFMQSRVDDYYSAFTKGVAKGRAVPIDSVRNGMGQGRVLGSDQAFDQKMIDGVMTFDDVVKRMQRNSRASRSALKAAQNELAILG